MRKKNWQRVPKKLHEFLTINLSHYNWNIVIVDNASIDKSADIGKKLARKYAQMSFVHMNKRGRGRAVRSAWLASNADIIGYTDVDLSTDLSSLLPMLQKIQKNCDIVIASRLLPDSNVANRTFLREVISRVYNVLLKIAFHTSFSDAQCGFKLITQKAFRKLSPLVRNNEWFFDTELLIIAEKIDMHVCEEAVNWRDNPGSTVRVLPTIFEDLRGVARLFVYKPWEGMK